LVVEPTTLEQQVSFSANSKHRNKLHVHNRPLTDRKSDRKRLRVEFADKI